MSCQPAAFQGEESWLANLCKDLNVEMTLKIQVIFLSFMVYSLHKKRSYSGYSGPYFPAFEQNTDQENSEYGHYLRSE